MEKYFGLGLVSFFALIVLIALAGCVQGPDASLLRIENNISAVSDNGSTNVITLTNDFNMNLPDFSPF